MKEIDYNIVMSALQSVDFSKELTEEYILEISQDFNEGVEFDYLITRLYLLNVNVNTDNVRKMVWKLFAKGYLILTVDRKLQFVNHKKE